MTNMFSILLRLRQFAVHSGLPKYHSSVELERESNVKELTEKERASLLSVVAKMKANSLCVECKVCNFCNTDWTYWIDSNFLLLINSREDIWSYVSSAFV